MLLEPSVRSANYSGRRTLLPGLTILSQECFSMSPGLLSMRMGLPEPIIPRTNWDWIHCRMRVIEVIGGRWLQTTNRKAELRFSKVQQTLLQDILYPPQLCMTVGIPTPETSPIRRRRENSVCCASPQGASLCKTRRLCNCTESQEPKSFGCYCGR